MSGSDVYLGGGVRTETERYKDKGGAGGCSIVHIYLFYTFKIEIEISDYLS